MASKASPVVGPPPAVPVIDPCAIYFTDTFQAIFRLRKSTIRREWKAGRLRLARRAGRHYLLGEWILEWLRSGECRPPAAPAGKA